MSVNHIGIIANNFRIFDIDGNGQLDKPEIARASINLQGASINPGSPIAQQQPDPTSQIVGSALGTMVLGGQDTLGLFPDFDNSGGISLAEFSQLAASSGEAETFEVSDFQTVFPNRFNPNGNTVSIAELQQLASQNEAKFAAGQPEPIAGREVFVPGVANPQSSQLQSVLPPEVLTSLLQLVMIALTNLLGSGNNT